MLIALLSAFLLQTPSAPVQIVCPAPDINLPASLAAWRSPGELTAPLRPGQTVTVAPATTPVTLEIEEAGTYGVAIDLPAWIDVAGGGTTLRSTAHGHGPACSTIRKIVDFALEPGRYTITLSRTGAASARLLVIRR